MEAEFLFEDQKNVFIAIDGLTCFRGPSADEKSAPLPSATTEPSSRMEIDNISTMVQQNLPEKSTASVPQ